MLILNRFHTSHRLIALAIASVCFAGPSIAKNDKGQEHGGGRAEKQMDRDENRADKRQREDIRQGEHFNDQHRALARDYYGQTYGNGKKCPPGLAKKHNGCMPPGQVNKNLTVGQTIPSGVRLYPVPQQLISGLPPAPIGTRYVRIGNEIVLIRQQNNSIVDIINGLLR